MSLRSSMHIFTSKPEKVVKYITSKIRTDQEELSAIENYFERIRNVRKDINLDEEPLHNRERFFARELFASYSKYVPSFIIKQDFDKRGIPLNIYGDIVIFPQRVSCISSRYFSCGDSPEGVVFHTAKGMSKELRSKVVAYSLDINEKTTSECRVYFADNGKICYIRRSAKNSRNTENNTELLKTMWAEIDWSKIISLTDVLSFSNAIELALQIPVDEDLSLFQYHGTHRLYGIYSEMK